MIPDFFIATVTAILKNIIELVPTWTIPVAVTQSWGTRFGTFVSWANGFFPVYDVAVCLGILVSIKVIILVWRGVVFIYDKIPFKAT